MTLIAVRIALAALAAVTMSPAVAQAHPGKPHCHTKGCTDRVKAKAFAKKYGGCQSARCVTRVRARMQPTSPRTIGRRIAYRNGFRWSCLDRLVHRESGWKVRATNPSSGAYGLPQALPGSKMASKGRNWRTSARTQLRWMAQYIRVRYRTACRALAFQRSRGWY